MKGISIREFARRDGCDKTIVRRALNSGRLQALADGSLDPELVGSGWRRGNEDLGTGDKTAVSTSPTASAASKPAAEPKPLDPRSKADAERRKEHALAETREIELDRLRGTVAPVEAIAAAVVAEYAKVRTRLISIPVKVAGRAATLRSPTEIQALLSDEINQALEELSIDAGGDVEQARREVRARAGSVPGAAVRRTS